VVYPASGGLADAVAVRVRAWSPAHRQTLSHAQQEGWRGPAPPQLAPRSASADRGADSTAYRSAYFRFAKGHPVDQLAAALSGTEERKGLSYVVLRDGSRTLAVYRIKNDGHLHRLKRWPPELDED
jgi:hypothetical protein